MGPPFHLADHPFGSKTDLRAESDAQVGRWKSSGSNVAQARKRQFRGRLLTRGRGEDYDEEGRGWSAVEDIVKSVSTADEIDSIGRIDKIDEQDREARRAWRVGNATGR